MCRLDGCDDGRLYRLPWATQSSPGTGGAGTGQQCQEARSSGPPWMLSYRSLCLWCLQSVCLSCAFKVLACSCHRFWAERRGPRASAAVRV